MPLEENAVVAGRYRLIRELSRGGMGTVWRAQDVALDAPCAIKLIHDTTVVEPARLARFEREAKAAALLRGPNVVEILDHGVWEGRPYIAMELLEGEDLADRIAREGALSAVETTSIVAHIARALTRAHAAGIIHRDVKPRNVFLCREEERTVAKLLDFGIAKAAVLGEGLDTTKSAALLGTPSYMSPEQAEGVGAVDFRSDLWSLGVIAFECMTGRVPIDSDALGDLLNRLINGPLPVPSEVAPVPGQFDRWFSRACARRVEDRFQSAHEMAVALAEALDVSDSPALRDAPIARSRSRSTWVLAAVAIGGAALVVLGLRVPDAKDPVVPEAAPLSATATATATAPRPLRPRGRAGDPPKAGIAEASASCATRKEGQCWIGAYPATFAVDGDPLTFWAAPYGATRTTFTIVPSAPMSVSGVVILERGPLPTRSDPDGGETSLDWDRLEFRIGSWELWLDDGASPSRVASGEGLGTSRHVAFERRHGVVRAWLEMASTDGPSLHEIDLLP